ncbi:signal transduction histidine kinase [Amycolatopsis viridis]|uniref:histidine kinase n=1 Tax=Amycolatopsis viridis TaxID=185678 RepID=A0ABX0SQC3_9PSEU|nr:signal transduction histidine kinase [Amycolatopsis viridis]
MREPRRWPALVDVVLTLVPMAFVLGATTGAGRFQGHPLGAAGYLWLAAAALPLVAVRRVPLPVFAVTAALTGAYYVSGQPGGPAIVLPTIALFVLTRTRGPLVAGIAGSVVVVAALAGRLATGVTLVVWLVAVLGIGTAVRNRVAATRAAAQETAERQSRLAEQERLRIAREVHDVVAHSLAMINVQAGVAVHVADRRPDQAVAALRAIKEASATALADLRATVTVLRSGQGLGPAPSLDQLDELLDHARATGLVVRVHGSPGDLPAPVDAAAYRILQESLTNVIRHANQPSTVDIRFTRHDGSFTLVVRDDGRGATTPVDGNGMRGMRERAAALGGEVAARVVDGGIELRAELPLEKLEER